jgi:hypothetical protein
MTATLHLTPGVAARMYAGPRYHRSRSPQDNRRLIHEQIRQFKASASIALRYMGCVLEAIAQIPPCQHSARSLNAAPG